MKRFILVISVLLLWVTALGQSSFKTPMTWKFNGGKLVPVRDTTRVPVVIGGSDTLLDILSAWNKGVTGRTLLDTLKGNIGVTALTRLSGALADTTRKTNHAFVAEMYIDSTVDDTVIYYTMAAEFSFNIAGHMEDPQKWSAGPETDSFPVLYGVIINGKTSATGYLKANRFIYLDINPFDLLTYDSVLVDTVYGLRVQSYDKGGTSNTPYSVWAGDNIYTDDSMLVRDWLILGARYTDTAKMNFDTLTGITTWSSDVGDVPVIDSRQNANNQSMIRLKSDSAQMRILATSGSTPAVIIQVGDTAWTGERRLLFTGASSTNLPQLEFRFDTLRLIYGDPDSAIQFIPSGQPPDSGDFLKINTKTNPWSLYWAADETGSPGAGDIEGVTAGNLLTGGGTTGTVSLEVDTATFKLWGNLHWITPSDQIDYAVHEVQSGNGLTGGGVAGTQTLTIPDGWGTTVGADNLDVNATELMDTFLTVNGDTAGTGHTWRWPQGRHTGLDYIEADTITALEEITFIGGDGNPTIEDTLDMSNNDIANINKASGDTANFTTYQNLPADAEQPDSVDVDSDGNGTTDFREVNRLIKGDNITLTDGTDGVTIAATGTGTGDIEGVTAGTGLSGGGTTGTVTLNVANVDSTMVATKGIGRTSLSDTCVSAAQLGKDAVTSTKIFAGAVTATKIGAGAVNRDKLSLGSTGDKISLQEIPDDDDTVSVGPYRKTTKTQVLKLDSLVTVDTSLGTEGELKDSLLMYHPLDTVYLPAQRVVARPVVAATDSVLLRTPVSVAKITYLAIDSSYDVTTALTDTFWVSGTCSHDFDADSVIFIYKIVVAGSLIDKLLPMNPDHTAGTFWADSSRTEVDVNLTSTTLVRTGCALNRDFFSMEEWKCGFVTNFTANGQGAVYLVGAWLRGVEKR